MSRRFRKSLDGKRALTVSLALFFILSSFHTSAQNQYTHAKPRSLKAGMVNASLALIGMKKRAVKRELKTPFSHKSAELPRSFAKKFDLEEVEFEGHKVWKIAPLEQKSEQTILFFHGGAYLYGIRSFYWNFIKRLIRETGATVIIPDYPLAPENQAVQVYSFLGKVYAWTLQKCDKNELIFLGDSAGGGLALGFAQSLGKQNQPLPVHLILFSPWLDLELKNPEIQPLGRKDKMLSVPSLRNAGVVYAGDWKTDDYRVSPINGEFQNLPEISFFVGTHEIFFADCEKLKKILDGQQHSYNYFVYPKMYHDWIIAPSGMKEGNHALKKVAELLKNQQ